MNHPHPNVAPVYTLEEQMRIQSCRELFVEALRRYKEQNERLDLGQTPMQIATKALMTLKQNGYTRAEVTAAMS